MVKRVWGNILFLETDIPKLSNQLADPNSQKYIAPESSGVAEEKFNEINIESNYATGAKTHSIKLRGALEYPDKMEHALTPPI